MRIDVVGVHRDCRFGWQANQRNVDSRFDLRRMEGARRSVESRLSANLDSVSILFGTLDLGDQLHDLVVANKLLGLLANR